MSIRHRDTYSIRKKLKNAIPYVSDGNRPPKYHPAMSLLDSWESWGRRLRQHVKDHEIKWEDVASELGVAESTIRSWLNGTREINLSDFVRLCKAAKADASQILFADAPTSETIKKIQEVINESRRP
jgi:hypothetical protein